MENEEDECMQMKFVFGFFCTRQYRGALQRRA